MATITKRKSGWATQIRRKGYEPEFQTFTTKAEAEKWSRERESEIDRGDAPLDRRKLRTTTLGDLIRRYLQEITPTKKSADSETQRMTKMLSAPMCSLPIAELSSASVSAYRDHRMASLRPATVVRELSLIHNVIDVARKDWGYSLPSNPVALVRKPKIRNARDRRLQAGEFERLVEALEDTRNPFVAPAIRFAIETALRRGELVNLLWKDINYRERTAYLPDTKNGFPRTIPLTDAAINILMHLPKDTDRPFPITVMALKLAWNRVRKRAGLEDIRIHDLRHEAITRFAEMGLSAMELALISGHRDPRMLFRYTHLRPAELARKLAGRSWVEEIKSR